VVDWCSIEIIIDHYVSETTKLKTGQLSTKYLSSASDAKTHWSHWQDVCLQKEQYLTNNNFQVELNT
jgi:hypothetical protein